MAALNKAQFSRVLGEATWIAAGQVLSVLGALFGVKILTGLLSAADYGVLALGMTIYTLVNQVFLGPVSNGALRFFAPAAQADDLGGYWNAIRQLVRRTAGVIAGIGALATALLALLGRKDLLPMLGAALAYAVLAGAGGVVSAIQSAARQRAVVAIHQAADTWARFALAALMVIVWSSSTAAMVGFAASAALILFSQSVFLRRAHHTALAFVRTPERWRQEIWAYSWPFASYGVFTWAQAVSDRWVLQSFSTAAEVGRYAVLYQIGFYPVSLAATAALQLITPIVFRDGDSGGRARGERINHFLVVGTLAVTAAAVVVAAALHRQILLLVATPEYAVISHLLPWIVLAGGLFATGQAMALHLQREFRSRSMVPAKIGTAVFGVLANIAGAYYAGATGVVLASVAFSLCYLIWIGVVVRACRAQASAVLESTAIPTDV